MATKKMSRSTTKSQVLHEASRMLLMKGLTGFSLQELAESLHIKKASLFHHYPSKLALAIELYRYYQNAFSEWIKKYEKLPPEKQVMKYAEKITSWIIEKQRVCPVGALSLEWEVIEPDLQNEIIKLHELQKKWLTKLISKMDLNTSKNDAVMGLMSLMQGSIQLARINNDNKLVIKNIKHYIRSIKK